MTKLRTLLLIPALLMPVGCDGGSSDDEDSGETMGTDSNSDSGGDLSFEADVQPILDSSCALAGCHDAGADNVSYVAGEAYDNIVNQPSTIGMNLVTPGDSSMSYLWLKIDGSFTDVGGTGAPMPIGGTLSGADQATIQNWIDGGANP